MNHFYYVSQRIVALVVTKMIDLNTSRKQMGWNGQDSL